jgi:LmbE family N-acetylglucosaminyl deacetylase
MTHDVRPVAVISPHPDDESFGCGGTIKHLTQSGVAVDVIYMTCGELGFEAPEAVTAKMKRRLAETRMAEAHAACEVLGVRKVHVLHGADGQLPDQPFLARELADILLAQPYQRVFCPWVEEAHADHRATFLWTDTALATIGSAPDLWLYEVWSPLRPNTFVPIDGTIESKRAAIACHRSQLAMIDYYEAFIGLASYRAVFCPPTRFAEAFLVRESPRFR